MAKFADKVIIVTGASSGIGQSTAELLAKEGAKVAITGRSEKGLEETKQLMLKAGGNEEKILTIAADVTNEEDTKRIVAETVKKFGKLDILVNNAGAGTMEGYPDSSIAQPLLVYDYINNLNARSVIALCQEAIPHLKASKGNIVNVSSIGSLRASPNFMYYQMAKAALDHFTRILAAQLAPEGVRVNVVNPGAIRTNWLARTGIPQAAVDALEKSWLNVWLPMRRVGEPIEIAKTIAFLASDDASYITGQMIVADGGAVIATVPMPKDTSR
uniref:Uncharacterized protein n=2 Tax=Plectus sambesii TaxID=2011161 RepID=A0A914W3W9_9BILA